MQDIYAALDSTDRYSHQLRKTMLPHLIHGFEPNITILPLPKWPINSGQKLNVSSPANDLAPPRAGVG